MSNEGDGAELSNMHKGSAGNARIENAASDERSGGPDAESPNLTQAAENAAIAGNIASVPENEMAEEPSLQLDRRLAELCGYLEEANQISQDRERIIDRLHEENQQLRRGEIQQAMMPIYRDLIRLHDDLLKTARDYPSGADSKAGEDFRGYSDVIVDILSRYGVERYDAADGEPFNPKEHRSLAAVSTADVNLDRKIAKVIRVGFRTETRSVRLLEAEVYRVAPTEAAQAIASDQPVPNN